MVGAIARGANGTNLKFLKSMVQKGYCTECSRTEMKRFWNADEREEEVNDRHGEIGEKASAWWIPDPGTGIYYPKGQEKVMEDVPVGAAKLMEEVHCFSCNDENVYAFYR